MGKALLLHEWVDATWEDTRDSPTTEHRLKVGVMLWLRNPVLRKSSIFSPFGVGTSRYPSCLSWDFVTFGNTEHGEREL